jgi:hypothetical protein
LLQGLPNIEDQHVEAAWEDIKQAICEAADNILGQTNNGKKWLV